MKHRLQEDKKPLTSDGREPGLILAQRWGVLVLRVVFVQLLIRINTPYAVTMRTNSPSIVCGGIPFSFTSGTSSVCRLILQPVHKELILLCSTTNEGAHLHRVRVKRNINTRAYQNDFGYIFCQCPVVQFTIVILNPILYFLGMLFSSGKRYLFINTAILIDVCYHFLLRLY